MMLNTLIVFDTHKKTSSRLVDYHILGFGLFGFISLKSF